MLTLGAGPVAEAQRSFLPGTSINMADKQRFLSQRMGKDYVFRFLNQNADVATREMQSSAVQFEENLKILKANTPSTIAPLLAKEESLWTDYKKLLLAEPNRANAQAVLNFNSQLLAATNDVVVALIKWAATQPQKKSETGALPDVIAANTSQAGRIRLLAQRLTLYYGAYVGGLTTPNNDTVKQIQQIATGIQASITTLVMSDANTIEVDDAITQVIIDWRQLEEKCNKNNCLSFEDKSMEPSEVFNVTNRMLANMDKITATYANLLD
ncbi:type IV pili methyl-accepting chemotaxis transducer N-terminal domain-containing protein [Fibrella sp. WM1]|uniref:type IV pili methyl-accepting chemotaxis transducer N-terminal domain-containing protein n=1 Tax=Fibrella musci TaxID=3242485 RepID=UPI00351FB316